MPYWGTPFYPGTSYPVIPLRPGTFPNQPTGIAPYQTYNAGIVV